jgi:hypothetical protein
MRPVEIILRKGERVRGQVGDKGEWRAWILRYSKHFYKCHNVSPVQQYDNKNKILKNDQNI